MSSGVSQSYTVSEMTLFAEGIEETFAPLDTALPNGPKKGELTTVTRHYTVSLKQEIVHTSKMGAQMATVHAKIEQSTLVFSTKPSLPTPLEVGSHIGKPVQKGGDVFKKGVEHTHVEASKEKEVSGKTPKNFSESQQTNAKAPLSSTAQAPKTALHSEPKAQAATSQERMVRGAEKGAENHTTRGKEKGREEAPLATRQWSTTETKKWWEGRYHEREREGGREQHQEQKEREEKKMRVGKCAKVSASGNNSDGGSSDGRRPKKPLLQAPKIGIFALYYILTKIGICSDGASNYAYKKEIDAIDAETTIAHKKRLDELKEAIRKEKEHGGWSISMKVFSWIASIFGVIAGIALIVTGVGAVAGAMMIAGGLIQVTSQIMELTGGWQKIAELLPGEDSEKKRAVLTWMQIGIAVLCLILSAVGVIWGGFSRFGEAMQTAAAMIAGVYYMGAGITSIGYGITGFMFFNRMGDLKKHETKLAELKHKRNSLMEAVELGVDRLEQLFEEISRALDFEEELFVADQLIYRR